MRPSFLVVALCLAWSIQVPAAAQGLGDAAKREKTKRAQSQTSAKVHTNDSVLPVQGAPETSRGTFNAPSPTTAASTDSVATPAPTEPRSRATTPSTNAAPSTESGKSKDEETWRRRWQSARDRVLEDEREVEALERQLRDPPRPKACKGIAPNQTPRELQGAVEMRDRLRAAATADACRQEAPVTQAQVDAARAELERARRDLDALRQEAHAKGIYPELPR